MIFEIDNFDSFLFDNNFIKFNSHFLNIINTNKINYNNYNNTNEKINKEDFKNLLSEKYIKTNLIINKFFSNNEKYMNINMNNINSQPHINPKRISDWEYEVYIAYKIDESFEYDLIDDFNLTNKNKSNEEEKKDEKEFNNNYNNNNEFISFEKLNILQDLIYNKNSFTFNFEENESEENPITNKNSFKVLSKDPYYDFNIRYSDSNIQYTKEEKLENGKNLLSKGKCINISNVDILKEKLKGKNHKN